MKKHLVIAAVLVAWFAVPARAQVSSNLTIDSIKVTAQPGGQYKIVMTFSATLGTTDTFTGIRTLFIDPNGATVAPVLNFTPPAPGKTSTGTAQTLTGLKGNWTGEVDFYYQSPNNQRAQIVKQQTFTVP